MDKCVILVDNSNVFIGGQQLSAERQGISSNGNGNGHAPVDRAWRLDFEGLRKVLADGREVHAAFMVGSQPANHEGPWEIARHSGWEVIVHERGEGHAEKCADTELVVRGAEVLATAPEPMVLVIASGDRDFVPLVDAAHRHGWKVELRAFTNSYPEDGDLAQSVDRVQPLDAAFEEVGFRDEG